MYTKISALVVAAGLGIAAQQAAAVVTFAFDDNPGPDGQFTYTQPAFAGELGLLTYDSSVLVDLAVDATGEGGSEYEYTDAFFAFSANVGAVNPVPFLANTYFAPLTGGTMVFFSNGGDLLLTGTFGVDVPAQLVIVVDTGAIHVSVAVGGLNYTPSAVLKADLEANIGSEIVQFNPPFDAVWTLTNLSNLTTIVPPGGPRNGDVFLGDFTANSSFSGTIGVTLIPTPASIALAGIGVALVGIRRRR